MRLGEREPLAIAHLGLFELALQDAGPRHPDRAGNARIVAAVGVDVLAMRGRVVVPQRRIEMRARVGEDAAVKRGHPLRVMRLHAQGRVVGPLGGMAQELVAEAPRASPSSARPDGTR